MKRYLLSVMLCVAACVSAWGYGGDKGKAYDYNGTEWTVSDSRNGALVFYSTPVESKQQYIESTTAGLLSQWITDKSTELQYFNTSDYNLVKLSGKFNSADLLALFNTSFFSGYPCVDLSDVEIEGDIDWSEVASALDRGETTVAQTIVLPTSPAPEAATKGIFFNKFQCVAYFEESEKRNLGVYCLNDKVSTLLPVVSENMSIRYSQYYNNDGSQPTDGRLYPSVQHTAMDGLKSLPVAEVDFTWANVSDLKDGDGKWHFDLNANTHYLVIPQSVSQYSVDNDFTNESESNYRYGDNIWVVSTYKGTDFPYATGAVFGGQFLATNSDGINETANITYIRKNGALAGATPYLTDYAMNADRMIVVSKADADKVTENYVSDLTSMANSHSVSVDLTQYIVPDGEDISSYGNEYVNHIALPDNTPLATMEKILANCSCPTAIGVYDTDDHHLYTHSQAPNQLTKVVQMIESARSGDTAAGDATKVTMKGLLTGADIACSTAKYNIAADGTIDMSSYQGSNAGALDGAAIKEADFSEAAFVPQEQFVPAYLGYANTLETIALPNSEVTDCDNQTHQQTILPEHCFDNSAKLNNVCIPGSYEEIGRYAFYNCGNLTHIYTTGVDDATGFLSDNGEYTLTLPPSLKKIGTGAFYNVKRFTDVYITTPNDATVPECEQDAFDVVTYYGSGGDLGPQEDHMTRYQNPDTHIAMALLHWPENENDLSRIKCYTDVLREYTRVALGGDDYPRDYDAEGNLLAFPRQSEYYRSYFQAILGYVFTDWDMSRAPKGWNNEYEFTVDYFTSLSDASNKYPGGTSYDKEKYCGWHQFVLNGNFSFITRMDMSSYKENDWYTICMPYDLTKEELLTLFGAQYEEGKETKVDGTILTEGQKVYPKVVTLTGAKRDKENQKIYLHLSKDLLGNNVQWDFDDFSSYYSNYEGRDKQNAKTIAQNHTEESKYIAQTNEVVIRAGYPYLIKPYLSDEDLANAQAGYRGVVFDKAETAKYPYYTYRVVATNGETGTNGDIVDRDDNKIDPSAVTDDDQNAFTYHFVGTLKRIDGGIPQYAYYLGKAKSGGKHQFFRHTSATPKNWSKNACIILANLETPKYGQHGSAENIWDYYWFVDWTKAQDDSFKNANGEAKLTTFDMYFDEGEVTGIHEIENSSAVRTGNTSNGKVYNVNGQYVGTSLDGLAKGMYIVNGKKFVVK